MTYTAPCDSLQFNLSEITSFGALCKQGEFGDFSFDICCQILSEAGKFAKNTLAPLNAIGDKNPCRLENGVVYTPKGWQEAFRLYNQNGWAGTAIAPEYGGMGLPETLAAAVFEIISGANMAFAVSPLLNREAARAIASHASPTQQKKWLPQLATGNWSGAMNLTESQAGSDLGALTCRAEPYKDDLYKITGNKIYISYGDHDCAENILNLVLARLPEAPSGTSGISLFAVPKYLDHPDCPHKRNRVNTISVEKKVGIHGSPTCAIEYLGAFGYLLGEKHQGMQAMFTMMNGARLGVAIQGVGIMERAYQTALAFAHTRQQGKDPQTGQPTVILRHIDIRRQLLHMQALCEAGRSLCLDTALQIDLAEKRNDPTALARASMLTPIAKAWCSDLGVETASMALQIHGGMGYMEETGIAQLWRDARIAPIYEGTNAIQALHLVTRELPRENGKAAYRYFDEIRLVAEECRQSNHPLVSQSGVNLGESVEQLIGVTDWILEKINSGQIEDARAGATAYLTMFAMIAGGMYLAKGALCVSKKQTNGNRGNRQIHGNDKFRQTRISIAHHYALTSLPMACAYPSSITMGAKNMAEHEFL